MLDFNESWRNRYGHTPPVGWRLRGRFGGPRPSRWFRIHGLPEMKRYPETPEEIAEVHRRHEALAAELFSFDDGACWVIVPQWKNDENGFRLECLPDLEFTVKWRLQVREIDDDLEDPSFAWGALTRWSAEETRAARELIMQDEERILWVVQETLEVFAPYDGGVDVIAADGARRDDLARRFKAWRSPRPDGL